MELFEFETIDSLPALHHPGLEMIVIADLHLGLEASMTSMGSYVPEFQLDDLREELEDARRETEASRLLVNGDLKNEFRTSYAERSEVQEFLQFAKETFDEVILVKGNHDTMIEETVDREGLELQENYSEDGVTFAHGHEKVGNGYDTLVIGHEHPALKLEDEIGVSEKVDCFLYGEMRDGSNIIVMPSYAQVSEGSQVNEMPQKELLSPVLREQVDIDELEAVAVSREAGLFEFPEIGRI
ncbi:MAG: metallophosphoesterase [Candidatus Nanohaloarchaea archaeon]